MPTDDQTQPLPETPPQDARDEQPAEDTDPIKLKEALRKEREARRAAERELKPLKQAAADREDADRKAAEEKARQTGQYEELIATRDAEIKELRPKLEQSETTLARYQEALTKHLDAQRKDLPAHLIALLDKLDPVDQLEWIAANGEAIAPPARPAGNPRGPRPASGPTDQEQTHARSGQNALYRGF